MTTEREYDVVLFGATGFTGRLVAHYLAETSRTKPLRWALAGRNAQKLEGVRRELASVLPGDARLGLIEASSDDPASLARMARSARVVLTTVGPYALYGEPLVEACVREGADYVDLTGEPSFVNRLIERHHEEAREAGVRIVNCCGFDSIPHDLGALFTVQKLPKGEPITLEGFVRTEGSFSGGTWQSLLNEMGGVGFAASNARPWAKDPLPEGRVVEELRPRVRKEPDLGGWACPMPSIDPQIVLRSARALDVYGPDFRYGHNLVFSSPLVLAGVTLGMGAVVGLSQIGPARKLLSRLRPSGEGPSAEQRARSWFEVTFRGRSSSRRVLTRVSGGDPGYGETSKMIAESALCLAFDRDRLPPHVGVVTPAAGMGEALIERLQAAGIRFEVLEG
ncbi:saccharopine dehydrogenase NADP-binding domain-containing protein [Polyangium sp. y55x31]|uniref:saccharopine dehydrogenase family protein n=1 Tax=Polyangium sp. y55x31 TaxID=3042688 RepID=UPI002482290E|nr:saccharopine dehydrogenase NADP-binding domain-containing protein [Polyangium sp. y55x31]MDI1475143.1 saccharopine dehydrogenase NADP-binding domain-containing protein [Polyangium sp. y55x31]